MGDAEAVNASALATTPAEVVSSSEVNAMPSAPVALRIAQFEKKLARESLGHDASEIGDLVVDRDECLHALRLHYRKCSAACGLLQQPPMLSVQWWQAEQVGSSVRCMTDRRHFF